MSVIISITYTQIDNNTITGDSTNWGKVFNKWLVERYVPTISNADKVKLAEHKKAWETIDRGSDPTFMSLWKLFVEDANVKVS